MSPVAFFLLLVLGVTVSGGAVAHTLAQGAVLSSVLHHPALVPVHALAFIAGGLWGGQQPGRAGWAWIGALVVGVVLGIALAVFGWPPLWRSPVLFASITVFGAATVFSWRPPVWIGSSLYFVAGIYQGVVGSLPEYLGGSGHNSMFDIAVAAVVLSVLARALSVRARSNWANIVVRIAGSWIAATGILLMAFSLRLYLGLPGIGHPGG